MPARDGAVRIPQYLRVVVRVDVDVSRGDDVVPRVDHPVRGGFAADADSGDLTVFDTYVRAKARDHGAVYDGATPNQYVVVAHFDPPVSIPFSRNAGITLSSISCRLSHARSGSAPPAMG